MGAANADASYRLYRAGVLTGNDSAGTFTPSASIERSAVAALVTRADTEQPVQAVHHAEGR